MQAAEGYLKRRAEGKLTMGNLNIVLRSCFQDLERNSRPKDLREVESLKDPVEGLSYL